LVLAIPNGGVITGAELAHELGAEFDVVLSRRLQAPPNLTLGAVSEQGHVYLNPQAKVAPGIAERPLTQEISQQRAVLTHEKRLLRKVRPPAQVTGRSVLVTDDGIRTGATMIAALQFVRTQNPLELIVAVPVACAAGLREVRRWCDEVVWLVTPEVYRAIEEFYEGFPAIKDSAVLTRLREFAPVS
jgi:predicted phosphoribosyltransferase